MHNARYVEGTCNFGFTYGIHGWIELEDGTIIDPTRAWAETYQTEALGIILEPKPEHYVYYPLVKYTKEELKGKHDYNLPIALEELWKQSSQITYSLMTPR